MSKHIIRNRIGLLASLFCIIFFIESCAASQKYDEEWILGKTYSQIVEEYGEFDLCSSVDAQGINCACGYLTGTNLRNMWEELPDEFFMIYFDDSGVAYRVKKNVPRPGG